MTISRLLRERIQGAITYRERVVRDTDAYRVIFSEGDFLPGLIVDRYNDLLSIQALTQAMDAEPVRQHRFGRTERAPETGGDRRRVDPRIRELEQLPARPSGLVQGTKSNTIFTMNTVKFHYEALEDRRPAPSSTSARTTRPPHATPTAKLWTFAATRVVSHFIWPSPAPKSPASTALYPRSKWPTAMPRSIAAISNGWRPTLSTFSATTPTLGRRYDTIVLDPPAFAKSKSNLETALRGYKELNLRALKMLRPGGILVTCCCSYHVSPAQYLDVVRVSAQDVRRNLRIIETRSQSKDHPILPNVPETEYLKCVIAYVSN